ncbi:hypothetical protein ACFLUV_07040, partial [Elusimicrobiota bacterium]
VTDLTAFSTPTVQGVMLKWTSPSDDYDDYFNNADGYYYVKYATFSALTGNPTGWWNNIPNNTGDRYSGRRKINNPQDLGELESGRIKGLYPHDTYWFAIRAYDEADNESSLDDNSFSSVTQASATVVNLAPVKPTGLDAPSVTDSSMKITWNANSEADVNKYWIYRSVSSSSKPKNNDYSVVYATANTNSYKDKNVNASKYYSYWVKAVDDFGWLSSASGRVSCSPDLDPPKITHIPLKQRALGRSSILIDFEVKDDLKIVKAEVIYRDIKTKKKYKVSKKPGSEPKTLDVSLEVDKDNITEKGFKYYITASDGVNQARYPKSDLYRFPYYYKVLPTHG